MRRSLLLLIVSISLLSGLLYEAPKLFDPIRLLIDDAGHLQLHGSIGSDILDYLQHGPPPKRSVTLSWIDANPGQTMSWRSETTDISAVDRAEPSLDWSSAITVIRTGMRNTPSWIETTIVEPIRHAIAWALNLFVGTASARTATWDGGGADNNWSTCANWDGPDTCPIAADAVVFSATSVKDCTIDVAVPALASITLSGTGSIYSGTITVNINQTATFGGVTFSSGTTGVLNTNGFSLTVGTMTKTAATSGTLTLGSSTVTTNGTWDVNAATFNFNTSTLVFGASGNLRSTPNGNRGVSDLYNLTVNAGFTVTLIGNNIGVMNVVTLGAGAIINQNGALAFLVNSSSPNPISCGAGAGFSSTGGNANIVFYDSASWTFDANCVISGTTLFNFSFENSVNATTITVTPSANLSFSFSNTMIIGTATGFSTGTTILGMGAFNLTASTISLNVGSSGSTALGAVTFTTGAMSVASLLVRQAGSYMTLGSGAHMITGLWNSLSTSASWSSGSGTVTFSTASGTTTITPGNLGANEFNNVTFQASSTTAVAFTIATRSMLCGGTVIIAGTSTPTTLTVSTALNVTASFLNIQNPGILVKTGASIVSNHLLISGFVQDGGTFASNFEVTNSEGSASTTFSTFRSWSSNQIFAWTHSSSSATTTITFSISANNPGQRFSVQKNNVAFSSGTVSSSGKVVFQMLGSDPDMIVTISSATNLDLTIVYLFIFAFLLLIVFGFIFHPIFFILAGIEGVFMSYDVWVVTNNEVLTGVFFAFSLMVLVVGTFRFVEEEVL